MKKLFRSKTRILIGAGLLFAIMSLSNSCSKSSTPDTTTNPGTNEVWIETNSFNPATITVSAGTTITWTNKAGVQHTVTSDTGEAETFDSGTINTNGTWPHLFSTAGTFKYHCTVHPSMKATVIVN